MHLMVTCTLLLPQFVERAFAEWPEAMIPVGLGLVALLVLLSVWAVKLPSNLRARKGGVLEPLQLEGLMPGQKPVIVDLRSKEDFFGKHGHISTSRSIPFPELRAHLGELEKEAKGTLIVLVDETDELSHKAKPMLEGIGITWIYVLKGGFKAWRAGNFPVYSAKP